MSKSNLPSTPALRWLREAAVDFNVHLYKYVDQGGTAHSAQALGVPEHQVIKTLVMEDDQGEPLVVLMHGDREVSTKALARLLGVKTTQPCSPAVAQRHSGYQVGGTSPFGMRKSMPLLMEKTVLDVPLIYINGGARGLLVSLSSQTLLESLRPRLVEVAR